MGRFDCENPFTDTFLALKPEMLEYTLNRVNFVLLNVFSMNLLHEWLTNSSNRQLQMWDRIVMMVISLTLCFVFYPFLVALAYFLACGYYKEVTTFVLVSLLQKKVRSWLTEIFLMPEELERNNTRTLPQAIRAPVISPYVEADLEQPEEYRINKIKETRSNVYLQHTDTASPSGYRPDMGNEARSSVDADSRPAHRTPSVVQHPSSLETPPERSGIYRRNPLTGTRPIVDADTMPQMSVQSAREELEEIRRNLAEESAINLDDPVDQFPAAVNNVPEGGDVSNELDNGGNLAESRKPIRRRLAQRVLFHPPKRRTHAKKGQNETDSEGTSDDEVVAD